MADQHMRIPRREAWGELGDMEIKRAFDLYGGKSRAEAGPDFARDPIERMEELLFVPWDVFAFYVFPFADFLTSDASREASGSASCFLSLLRGRARAEPQKFGELYPRLQPAVALVAGRQSFYDADVHIYGAFPDIRREIEAAASGGPDRHPG